MELRQLRYFIRVVDLGSFGRAAKEFDLVTSALSQQIGRLETELSTRLLHRSPMGVLATDAGLAFYRQAQLALRHVDDAIVAAQQARLSGHVSLGLAPSTAAVLALPYMQAMRNRYPDVRLRLVESLSSNLSAMFDSRQLDLAMLFDAVTARRGHAVPLVRERLFLIGSRQMPEMLALPEKRVEIRDITAMPLVLGSLGVRHDVDAAFARVQCVPQVAMEIDGLPVLLDAVRAGLGATIQPGAAIVRLPAGTLRSIEIADIDACRLSTMVSLRDEELSPAVLAARIVLRDTARQVIDAGHWPGASFVEG
ncbi:LysR substrate-binding domain-containing protein [Xylophilus sp. GOD-11R]|uniref:LysR substrate-binding domain-containing protein n=1 Tax=Xylophilus sp. GOD-11R TaxID=3089814 RepID=UPI00298C8A0A|nr:LysR substrate-binding domain-containing protein [Xylophilus sp. GOD-11R]WPB55917.1 LysR substrate-binding domain-containing protein [Xylophilus sp. GOD-11R]